MIDAYLRELAAALPRGLLLRRRLLAEVEDHLREAAQERGEAAAVAAFGPARELARSYRPLAARRVATLAILAVLTLPVLGYPITENSLPPAPWPGETAPSYLHWKQDTAAALYLLALATGALALARFHRGDRLLVAAVAAANVTLAGLAALAIWLSVQWADAVPGTPGWLLAVPIVQLVATAAAAALLGRALVLDRGMGPPGFEPGTNEL